MEKKDCTLFGDAASRVLFLQLVDEHDMDLIMNLAEKIVVISFGSKIAEGEPEAIKNDSVVIEAYLGSEDEPA